MDIIDKTRRLNLIIIVSAEMNIPFVLFVRKRDELHLKKVKWCG